MTTTRKRKPAAKKRDGLTAIYALVDRRFPDDVRYIGKTVNPGERLTSHRGANRSNDAPVANWCRKVRSEGSVVDMRVLAWVEDWESEEIKAISTHRAIGFRLLNIEGGGRGPHASGAVNPQRENGDLWRRLAAVVAQTTKKVALSGNTERSVWMQMAWKAVSRERSALIDAGDLIEVSTFERSIAQEMRPVWFLGKAELRQMCAA